MNRIFITVLCCLSISSITVDCHPQLGEWIAGVLGITTPKSAVKYPLVQERDSYSDYNSGLQSRSGNHVTYQKPITSSYNGCVCRCDCCPCCPCDPDEEFTYVDK